MSIRLALLISIDRASILVLFSEPVVTFAWMTALKNAAVGWNIDDFDQLGAVKLEGAPRWQTLWIAGNPQRIEPRQRATATSGTQRATATSGTTPRAAEWRPRKGGLTA
ncbi:MAG TPA: hypothetical protein VIY99_04170 [Terracidiphilus sp.]